MKVNRDTGCTEYWLNGAIHRENGPAVISSDGTRERWFLKGKWYTDTKRFCEDAQMSNEDTVIMLLKYGDSLLHPYDHMYYEVYEFRLELTKEIDMEIMATLVELAKKEQDDD